MGKEKKISPSKNLGQGLDVAIDDLVASEGGIGGLHDDKPVLEVTPVE